MLHNHNNHAIITNSVKCLFKVSEIKVAAVHLTRDNEVFVPHLNK